MSMLSRTDLITFLAGGEDRAAMEKLVDRALARLGWQDKQSFSREDALGLTVAIAQLAQAQLAESPDPAARKLAEGMAAMLGAKR